MKTTYNEIAGQSVERLAALSDSIFGVAMTLLLLDLHVPAKVLVHSEGDLRHALVLLAPDFLVYLMSFLTLGIFWVGQQTQLNHLERSERHLTWIHLAFLFLVTLMPFSTRLLIEFITFRTALLSYWANIVLLGAMLYASWGRSTRASLIKSDTPPEIPAAICRRIWIAQSFYAFGALLCLFQTYWSIGFIVLVQLNYALAPRFWRTKRSEDA
ncbi:MAG: TMEM175 family protein [Candidatus Acidiferrum sp.]